jgi:hypothetical protein
MRGKWSGSEPKLGSEKSWYQFLVFVKLEKKNENINRVSIVVKYTVQVIIDMHIA